MTDHNDLTPAEIASDKPTTITTTKDTLKGQYKIYCEGVWAQGHAAVDYPSWLEGQLIGAREPVDTPPAETQGVKVRVWQVRPYWRYEVFVDGKSVAFGDGYHTEKLARENGDFAAGQYLPDDELFLQSLAQRDADVVRLEAENAALARELAAARKLCGRAATVLENELLSDDLVGYAEFIAKLRKATGEVSNGE